MTSTFPLVVLLLVMLSAMLFGLISAEGGFGEVPRLMERVGISSDVLILNINLHADKAKALLPVGDSKLPTEFTSGDSRFSLGACTQDSDCLVGGCSSEVCGSEPGIVTTCELGENFPSPEKYTCGCVNKACGWR